MPLTANAKLPRFSGDPVAIAKYCKGGSSSSGTPQPQEEEIASPHGSFVNSCKNTQQNGWIVTATCTNRAGEPSQTTINFKGCPNHSLTNVNGNLVCGP